MKIPRLFALLLALFPFFATAQLNGVYTIGGANPDYATIASAAAALNQSGVGGPVVFNIRDGVYVEQALLNAIAGSSAVNTITFQGESGDSSAVLWEWQTGNLGANYVLFAQNVSHVTFRSLTMKRPITGNNGRTVVYIDHSSQVHFENCVISGSAEANNFQEDLVEAGYCNSLFFTRNRFVNGFTAVTTAGNYQGPYTDYAVFEENIFINQRDACVYGVYLDHVEISGNVFSLENKNLCTAIRIGETDSASAITGNLIEFNNSILSGNTGIDISYKTTADAKTLIANNMIGMFGGNGASNGIAIKSSTGVNVWFNTVRTQKTPGWECYAVSVANSEQIDVLNNNFVCEGSPTVAYFPSNLNAGDYNNYYTEPGVNWLAILNAGSHSHSVDPNFLSPADLHVATSDLADAGTPLTGMTHDFDGDLRDLVHPDIGADEFLPEALDAGVLGFQSPVRFVPYCDTLPDVIVTLKNFGLNPLNSVNIALVVNGLPYTTLNWTGALGYLDQEAVNLGSYPFEEATRYDLYCYTAQPNGQADGFFKNDTSGFLLFHRPLSGTYSLGGANADFATISEMNANLVNAGLCGPTEILIADGVYDDNIIIDTIPGSSAQNTLRITSASQDSSKTVITDDYPSPYQQLVFLDDVDYVTLSHLTFRDEGAGLDDLIRFRHGHDLAVTNSHLQGYYCNCAQNTDKGIFAVEADSNLTIRQNRIAASSEALWLTGNLVTGRDESVSFLVEQNEVYGSVLLTHAARPIIQDNFFSGTFSRVENCGGFEITHNRFFYGFALYSSTSALASLFQNNALYHYEPNGAGVSWDWALYLNGTSNVDIVHNTLKGAFNAGALGVNFSSEIRAFNNIFHQDAYNSNTLVYQAIAGSLTSDHNIFFRNDSAATVLTLWQTSTGQDLHSLFIDPGFSTGPDSSFYPTNGLMNNLGIPLGLTDDLYHHPRDLVHPEMGAIEFSLAPVADLGPDRELCEGIVLDALNPGAAFLWNDGSTAQTLAVQESGTYWVQVSTSLGVSSDTVQITLIGSPSVQLEDVYVCTGGSATLTAGVENADYLWSTGDTTASIQVSVAGVYSVTVTNSLGCSDQDTLEVFLQPLPEISLMITPETCLGDSDGSIAAAVTGGQGAYSFAWENSEVTEPVLSGLPPGSYTFVLTDGSCVYSEIAVVPAGADPLALILNADSACVGVPYGFLNGSTGADSYSWYIDEELESNQPQFEFTFDSPGTFLIALAAASGVCEDTAFYSLEVNDCGASGVSETVADFRIFPNPAGEVLFIQGLPASVPIGIYDLEGVLRIRGKATAGKIDISSLPAGFYLLVAGDENNSRQGPGPGVGIIKLLIIPAPGPR